MRYQVNFYDKNGTETRGLVVEANSDDDAEDKACLEADSKGWTDSFKILDAIPLD